jgi:hypothetical protein
MTMFAILNLFPLLVGLLTEALITEVFGFPAFTAKVAAIATKRSC